MESRGGGGCGGDGRSPDEQIKLERSDVGKTTHKQHKCKDNYIEVVISIEHCKECSHVHLSHPVKYLCRQNQSAHGGFDDCLLYLPCSRLITSELFQFIFQTDGRVEAERY